jgi:hypothetical protein
LEPKIHLGLVLFNLLRGAESLEADSCFPDWKIPAHLWDRNVYLPCSEKSATGPYPESVEFSPHSWILFI